MKAEQRRPSVPRTAFRAFRVPATASPPPPYFSPSRARAPSAGCQRTGRAAKPQSLPFGMAQQAGDGGDDQEHGAPGTHMVSPPSCWSASTHSPHGGASSAAAKIYSKDGRFGPIPAGLRVLGASGGEYGA